MADKNIPSNHNQPAHPAHSAKTTLPKMTALTTAFPIEIDSSFEPPSSYRRVDRPRQPRRHDSGR